MIGVGGEHSLLVSDLYAVPSCPRPSCNLVGCLTPQEGALLTYMV